MASGHQADVMKSRKLSFGSHQVPGLQLAVFDDSPYLFLNPPIGRNPVSRLRQHLDFLDSTMDYAPIENSPRA